MRPILPANAVLVINGFCPIYGRMANSVSFIADTETSADLVVRAVQGRIGELVDAGAPANASFLMTLNIIEAHHTGVIWQGLLLQQDVDCATLQKAVSLQLAAMIPFAIAAHVGDAAPASSPHALPRAMH